MSITHTYFHYLVLHLTSIPFHPIHYDIFENHNVLDIPERIFLFLEFLFLKKLKMFNFNKKTLKNFTLKKKQV